jgi:hypothetical protein
MVVLWLKTVGYVRQSWTDKHEPEIFTLRFAALITETGVLVKLATACTP